MNKNNGMLYVFTGNGKGKTSAGIGAVVRTAASGGKVAVYQFLKGQSKSFERDFFENSDYDIHNEVFGVGFFRKETQRQAQEEAAQKGWEIVKKAILSDEYDLIMIDELNVALKMELLPETEVKEYLGKRGSTHLVVTGRYAKDFIIEMADLVTEMKEIKHPYKKGIKPVKGLDF